MLNLSFHRFSVREFTNVRTCDKVGAVMEGGQEIFIQKKFVTAEKAINFKKSYEKGMYKNERINVRLVHMPVLNSSPKKKVGRPPKK